MFGLAGLRAGHADEKQRRSLAQQVCIGRKVGRKIAFNMASTQRQSPVQVVTKLRWHNRTPFQQRANPNPGHAAERHFQCAGPVDSNRVRVLLFPRIPLGQNFVGETFVAGQQIRLGQHHQMLMAIQFPRDFGIAHLLKIQVLHPKCGLPRSAFAVDFVQMPVDCLAVVEVFVAQQIEPVFQDLPGSAHDVARLFRQSFLKERNQLRHRLGLEKELRRPRGRPRSQTGRPLVAEPRQQTIPALGSTLAQAVP